MTSWAPYQERPSIYIPPSTLNEWPPSEQHETYKASEPWRVTKYDPFENGVGFDDDFLSQLEKLRVPKDVQRATATANQLIRFADMRQTRFKGPPNKDGSNTNEVLAWQEDDERPLMTNGSPGLRFMWKCYANILHAIHREGQIRGGPGGTWILEPLNELGDMIESYPDQLENMENERLRGHSLNNKLTPGFEWLYPYAEHLADLMASFQAIVTWAKEANENPKDYAPQAMARLPAIVLLLISLKNREIIFEDALGNEHFEDILIDKRFWMISPKDFYEFGENWRTPARKWTVFLNSNVKPRLATFRKQLQDRFDYRLLVDWGYGRLWNKLYIMYKTKNQAEKEAIREFSTFATRHSKLAFDLFALHPIDMDEMKADPCSVCLCGFEHGELVMETHCKHHFHPACLFTYWDDEHRFQNRCPECRTSQGVLREKVEFKAEREDRCYEARHELQGLEGFQFDALRERLAAGQAFGNSKALMEIWLRWKVEWLLKAQRQQKKQNTPGWDEIK